jgi:hypothetical protein
MSCRGPPQVPPLQPQTIVLSCREVPRPLPPTPTRSTFCFDLSGVQYKTRADLSDLRRRWDTFERIENYNSAVLKQLSLNLPGPGIQRDGSVFLRPADNAEKIDYTQGQLAHIARYPDISDFIVPYANRVIPYSHSTISSIFTNTVSTYTSTVSSVTSTYTSSYTSTYTSSIFSIIESLPLTIITGPPTQIIPKSSDYSEILENRKAKNLYIGVSTFTAKYPKSPYKFSSNDDYLLYKKYRDTIA